VISLELGTSRTNLTAATKIRWRIQRAGSDILPDMSDTEMELLARYVRRHAEDAFAEIVRRHLNLVYSAALRQIRSPQLAEEITQSVFIDLARNAARLKPDTILTAWLYQVTRRTAIDVVRRESSRQLREQIATEMNAMNATAADWTHIEPLLDEAMHALDDTDRAAVLLRTLRTNPSAKSATH
jgi:RNA polymerase sigma factor (sigma-70 family)